MIVQPRYGDGLSKLVVRKVECSHNPEALQIQNVSCLDVRATSRCGRALAPGDVCSWSGLVVFMIEVQYEPDRLARNLLPQSHAFEAGVIDYRAR
jgi:hypothetical protein